MELDNFLLGPLGEKLEGEGGGGGSGDGLPLLLSELSRGSDLLLFDKLSADRKVVGKLDDPSALREEEALRGGMGRRGLSLDHWEPPREVDVVKVVFAGNMSPVSCSSSQIVA